MEGVWIATMESENYTWTAVGKTEDEAIKAIVNEWCDGVGHERRMKMTRKVLEECYGINCCYYEFGKCQWY